MRNAILLVGVLIATTGCDQITSKLKGDAGATAATTPTAATAPAATAPTSPTSVGLPAECETFLTRYKCFLKSLGKPTNEADEMRAAWAGAVTPDTRPGILHVCTTQLSVQAENFKTSGCDGTTPAPVAKAATPPTPTTATPAAPAATPTPTATPTASAAPNAKPAQAACKPGEKRLRENHFTVKCMVPCKSDAECKGGKKCGATLYGDEATGAVTRGCE